MVKLSSLNLGLALIALVLLLTSPWVDAKRSQSTDQAYVTLLYGDEFLLGVRVLGKSIRDTGTDKDMVCLVSDGVSEYAKKLLEADGWIVQIISLLKNPNRVRPTRFWGVYTKLKIFNMVAYKKIVYLDADTIVVKSIEDLFKCGKFCANLKHSERMNSGVMVVEPSEQLFKDMMSKVTKLFSYTGGDQGFLNTYYSGFADAHLFDPDLSLEELKSRPVPEMQRLSTLYNADVGLYMLANKWMVNETDLRVIHYTLGPLKPWDWWTAWLVKPVDVWQEIRQTIEATLPGTGGGHSPNEAILVNFLFLLPVLFLVVLYYRSLLQAWEQFGSFRGSLRDCVRHISHRMRTNIALTYSKVSSTALTSNQQMYSAMLLSVPAALGGFSIVVCFITAVISLGLSFLIVPRQVMPWTGLLLTYEWTYFFFFVLFGGYLNLVCQWGRSKALQTGLHTAGQEALDYELEKGHQLNCSFNAAGWYYGLGMAFLSVATPSLPCLFGITALFARVGLMVVGGLIMAGFMSYASEQLAVRSYLRGLEERDTSRPRTLCLL
ncbi:hypothetical protein V2J09_008172 [Rumex salicifolius]